ncbi:cupin domain-containing protein [Roseimarinus sediminis]|uniref:cupin domain-containing protein n=1 Tax=Roseimarinus sediminis TaxID=1610899 RepID=UPI003D20AE64
MKNSFKYSLLFCVILVASCNMKNSTNEPLALSEPCFPKGGLLKSPNFTGTVWLNMMGAKDTALHASYGYVSFAPEARTNWHSHPGGQILFITEGKGYYQAKGQAAQLLQKGDYVEIPPNVVHWHGAAPDSKFAHLAVSMNTNRGGAVWLGAVTEQEYSFDN